MRINVLIALLLSSLFALPPALPLQPASLPEIDIPALLRESEQKTNQNCVKYLESLGDYTFKSRFVKREVRRNGSVDEESSVLEAYVPDLKKSRPRGKRVPTHILIERNGKPIPREKIEKERMKVAQQLQKDEEQLPDPDGHVTSSCQAEGKYYWLSGLYAVRKAGMVVSRYQLNSSTLLGASDFHSPQDETVNGRRTISLSFRPRTDAVFSQEMAWATKAEGKIWIDAEDKVITGVALWPRGQPPAQTSAEYLRSAAAVFYDNLRMKDGVWFDSYRRFDAGRFPETATIWKKEIIREYSNYERFTVQAEKEKIIAPDKPKGLFR